MAGWILLAPYSLQIKPPTASPILSEVLLLEFRPIWCFIHFVEVRVVRPILWPSDANSWLIGKDSDAGKDCRQEEKGMTEDEMVGWHHWLNGHEFEQTPGDGEGQGSLACCSPWGHKELDMTEQLNNSNWFSTIDSGSSAPHCQHKPHQSPCKASSCSPPWPTYHVTN